MNPPIDDGRCFACGPENEIGLHLDFRREGETVRATTKLAERFQGWRGMAHGGVGLALLDEAMAHAAGAAGYRGLTGSMNARFRKPLPLEQQLEIEGRVQWVRRNVLQIYANVKDASGDVLLEAEGKFVARGRVEDAVDRRNPTSLN